MWLRQQPTPSRASLFLKPNGAQRPSRWPPKWTPIPIKIHFKSRQKLNIDYDEVVEYATLDDRLGKSHWNVPGPDGDFGFGGHCLPKDLSALIYLAMKFDTETNVLNAVEETNDVVRKNRDWEDMKGRAVV